MRRSWGGALLAALLWHAGLALAAAPPDAGADSEQDLYVLAMRAISEGRDDDAADYLARMTAAEPRHASEWLDLAMIQCAIGHHAEAERLFQSIEQRFDPPQGIRELIHQQRAMGCKRRGPPSQLSLVVGRGYDRNVNQGASNPSYTLGGSGGATLELLPDYLPQSDRYLSLSGAYTTEPAPDGTVGFAQMIVRRNDRLASYNTASLFGGVERPWKLGRWKLRTTLFGGLLTLGGRLYQEQSQFQLKLTPPWTLPQGVEFSTLAGIAHVNYKTLTNFDANTEEVRAMLSYRGARTQLQLSAGSQNDHATGERPGGDRRGWSVGLSAYRRLGERWQVEAELGRQTWRGQTVYAASLIDRIRDQDTRVARAKLIYVLDEHQSLNLETRHVHNKENISIFQYNNTVWQLNWQWHGF